MSDELPPYTPQALTDILPIYHPANTNHHISIYTLHQTAPDTLVLTLRDHPSESATAYTSTLPVCKIRTNKTGGFMNRKPHVIITTGECDESLNRPLAEGRFDIHGTGTTISYSHLPNMQMIQRLELEDSLSQRLRTTIWGHEHWWTPNPGNKGVLELTNEMDEIVARFVHTVPVSQMTGSGKRGSTGRKKEAREELGDLHIVDALAEGGREEVICSALVVVERAKRRANNISCTGIGKTAPAWSMSAGPPGGFI
ncbi:hypothetical protein HO173_005433 [Letharia columbiana]|uniref:Uncharacterized protein n=1 Tax=Letharia columbiana TaxID=112416 RepID=A0A8H6FWX9_9LECA|nr:uncharacterized protein HO173_005433 [Letharia columbiana]KAF6236342.1 hypothetical protein HO173_005433 [Letharia columbiana]